ncbi:MAG: hypothetical protein SNJ70_06280 [Armatimonadota bacterium]
MMGSAYTPGLTISKAAIIKKRRRLPLKGEVLVNEGDEVSSITVVARAEIPGVLYNIKVSEILGLEPDEVPGALIVSQGDNIEAGQVVAKSSSLFGLIKSECKSPYSGIFEIFSPITGHLGLRLKSTPVEVKAYINGKVVEVMPDEGVVIETYASFIQGIFGVGGEKTGRLEVVVSSPSEMLDESLINENHKDCVLVGGSKVNAKALKKACEIGVKGIVVGAIYDSELIEYLGHDIGVAITGQENIETTLILTEGFGKLDMADRTFNLLKSLNGRKVSINGATQIRAGVIRPEIVAPLDIQPDKTQLDVKGQVLEIGTPIRIIREPYFGELASVSKLPSDPIEIESGAVVRVLEAELKDGTKVTIPRANVETISS